MPTGRLCLLPDPSPEMAKGFLCLLPSPTAPEMLGGRLCFLPPEMVASAMREGRYCLVSDDRPTGSEEFQSEWRVSELDDAEMAIDHEPHPHPTPDAEGAQPRIEREERYFDVKMAKGQYCLLPEPESATVPLSPGRWQVSEIDIAEMTYGRLCLLPTEDLAPTMVRGSYCLLPTPAPPEMANANLCLLPDHEPAVSGRRGPHWRVSELDDVEMVIDHLPRPLLTAGAEGVQPGVERDARYFDIEMAKGFYCLLPEPSPEMAVGHFCLLPDPSVEAATGRLCLLPTPSPPEMGAGRLCLLPDDAPALSAATTPWQGSDLDVVELARGRIGQLSDPARQDRSCADQVDKAALV